MAKNSVDAYGAAGKSNVLSFVAESLHLVTDTSHPLFDERVYLPLSESMVLNIMELGVLEPIIVWKDPESGKTCVVAGRQRVKSAIEANKRRSKAGLEPWLVPGIAKRGSAMQMAKFRDSENEIRQADTPIGRAKKMQQQMDYGHDESDVALLFGCSVKTVQDTIALLDCTHDVQAALESGKVTVTQARQLVDMPPEKQRETVKQLAEAAEGVTGHEKSRRQRAVLGDVKPRLKTRKEITKALQTATGDYAEALRWVLGEKQ